MVILGEGAVNRGCVNELGVLGIERNMCALATAHGEVVLVPNATTERSVRNGNRGVILLACIQAEGRLVIGNYAIELRSGLIHDAGPRVAAIEGYGGASVITVNEVCAVLGVEPHVMVITMRRRSCFKGFPTIN